MDDVITEAHGVAYTEVHGLRLFRCESQAATITVKSCLENYRLAKSELRTNYRPHLQHCAYCPIGACHAGEKPRARARTICPRCHRPGPRFVWSSGLCVSCYNRMGEVRRGKNRNGNPPVVLLRRAPVPHSVWFVHEGKLVRFDRLAVDSLEPLLAAVFLARSPETLRFTFGRPDLEPSCNEPAPNWQRPNAVMERRELDRKRTKKRRESKRCGTS